MSHAQKQLVHAHIIARTHGYFAAAHYLAVRGWSIRVARRVLLGL